MLKDIISYTFTHENTDIAIDFTQDSYMNISRIYTKFGKSKSSFSDFVNIKLTSYAERLIASGRFNSPNVLAPFKDGEDITVKDLIIINRGGRVSTRGAWVHPELMLTFARWLSLDFEIWCDNRIRDLFRTGITTTDTPIDEVPTELLPEEVAYNYALERIKRFSNNTKLHILKYLQDIINHAVLVDKPFEDVLIETSRLVKKATREELYIRFKSALQGCLKNEDISPEVHESYSNILWTYRLQLAHVRAARAESKVSRYKAVEVSPDSVDTIKKLNAVIKGHKQKLDSYAKKLAHTKTTKASTDTKPSVRPNLSIRPDIVATDLTAAIKQVNDTDGLMLVAAGFLKDPLYKRSLLSKTGALRPSKIFQVGTLSIAYYGNEPRSINIYRDNGISYSPVVKFIPLVQEEKIQTGSFTVDGLTYHAAIEPESGAFLIYSCRYKKDKVL